MGVDLLDITFRAERKLGVRLGRIDWKSHALKHQPPDIAVGELVDVFLNCDCCARCRYALRGHRQLGVGGVCPECGAAYSALDEPEVFEAVREAVVAVLGVEPGTVSRDALLIHDLGLS